MSNQLIVQNNELPAHIVAQLVLLPAVARFSHVAPFFDVSSAAIARRYERGTLGVRVIEVGGRLGVLVSDLAKFLLDGIPQEQPPLPVRAPRNPYGRHGKKGKRPARRPTKAEQIAARAGSA